MRAARPRTLPHLQARRPRPARAAATAAPRAPGGRQTAPPAPTQGSSWAERWPATTGVAGGGLLAQLTAGDAAP